MASYPSITFANNQTTPVFNSNTFQTKTNQSDNVTTSSLNVLGPSNLNTVNTNTITSSGLIRANNGLNVTGGTVSFVNNAIPITAVNGVNTRITTAESNIVKLQNATSGSSATGTITTNTLTIDYNTIANQTIIVVPTANFSINISNVPTSSLYAIYTITILLNAKFFCNSIIVNGTSISMNAFGGFANLAFNASATTGFQRLYIIFAGSTTPVKVTTELISIW